MRTGWVYRTEASADAVRPAPSASSQVVVNRQAPVRVVEQRFAAASAPPARGWIASGFYVMTLPMTVTIEMMLAPVNWIFGSRRH